METVPLNEDKSKAPWNVLPSDMWTGVTDNLNEHDKAALAVANTHAHRVVRQTETRVNKQGAFYSEPVCEPGTAKITSHRNVPVT